MSFFKELSTEVVNLSKKSINKADILAQIAKFKIEIEKKKREIVKIKVEIGDYIIEQHDKNEHPDTDVMQSKIERIVIIKSEIDHKNIEIGSLKSQLWESKSKNEDIDNPAEI
jgi:hypothetical protein